MEAMTPAGTAIQMANTIGQADLAQQIEARWRLYQARKPYRTE
jgi:hypothetical protein